MASNNDRRLSRVTLPDDMAPLPRKAGHNDALHAQLMAMQRNVMAAYARHRRPPTLHLVADRTDI